MLAKVWKKLLLAICIVAILFNITAKLVNRISLEKAIKSTPEGVNLKEVLNITDEEKTVNESSKTSSSEYKTVEEAKAEMEAKKKEKEKTTQVNVVEEVEPEEVIVETDETTESAENSEEETKTTGGQIINLVTDAVTNAKEQTKALY